MSLRALAAVVVIAAAACADRNLPLPVPTNSVLPTEEIQGRAIGATPGAFSVTSEGAASYSVPLWVPAGRAGVQPELALQYDSRAGDGMMGRGWSISGLPAISRCRKTIALDGYAAPIQFDVSDPFCLDGQRLILVNGTHASDGAEYRTERDMFAKVVCNAPDAKGPTSFTAHLKDGRILTFGHNGQDHTPPPTF
jgi:hypothetical protein